MINKNMGVQPITNEHHGSEAGGTFLAINLPFDPFGDDICHPSMEVELGLGFLIGSIEHWVYRIMPWFYGLCVR